MNGPNKLIEASIPFLKEIQYRTPGKALERWLNETYGAASALHRKLSSMIKQGVAEGWAASTEVHGRNYRRSIIELPTPETSFFSIAAVYMDSTDATDFDQEGSRMLRGQFHRHPYGEINLVAPLTAGAELRGPNGWQGAGWTSPEPDSGHYPETRGGALIALFYLPAGRVAYEAAP